MFTTNGEPHAKRQLRKLCWPLSCLLLCLILFDFQLALGQTTRRSNQQSNQRVEEGTRRSSSENSRRPFQRGQRRPASTAPRTDNSGQLATIRTESAMVYSDPDFDASVLTYLQAGKKVRVSKRIYGSYFKFFKVKVADKQYGYLATIDVEAEEGDAEDLPRVKTSKSKRKKRSPEEQAKIDERAEKAAKKQEGKKKPKKPMLATRYIGALLGMTQFKEDIRGVDSSDNLIMYGFKLTGPDVLLEGPVMDFNIAFHYGAPAYYEKLSTTKPTGFVVFTDALLIFPFGEGNNSLFYLGAGPMVMWSNFSVTTVGTTLKLSEINFGGSFALGGAYRFGSLALRLEGKMLQEKNQHRSIQLGTQWEF